jgi:hypothetical protein
MNEDGNQAVNITIEPSETIDKEDLSPIRDKLYVMLTITEH